MTDVSTCRICDSFNCIIDYTSDTVVCCECGHVLGPAFACRTNDAPNSCGHSALPYACKRGRGVKYQGSPYNPVFYAAELLRACQAEDPTVEDEFVDRVKTVIKTVCGGLPEHASRERIRRVCNYLGRPGYGERWWQIHLKLANLPLSFYRPPEVLITAVKKLFTVYCTTGLYILRSTKLWHPRKTLLSYNYVFRQLLRLLDEWYDCDWHDIFGHRFPLLKTREKIILSDQRWLTLCNQVNMNRRWFTEPDNVHTLIENRKWAFKPLLTNKNLAFIS